MLPVRVLLSAAQVLVTLVELKLAVIMVIFLPDRPIVLLEPDVAVSHIIHVLQYLHQQEPVIIAP